MDTDVDVRAVRELFAELSSAMMSLVRESRRAACATLDTAQLFAEGRLMLSQLALLVCGPCPVYCACLWGEVLHEAATGEPRFGLWGETPEDRDRLSNATTLVDLLEDIERVIERPIEVDEEIDDIYLPLVFGNRSLRDKDAEKHRLRLVRAAERLRALLEAHPEAGQLTVEDMRPTHAPRTTLELGRRKS